MMTPNRTRALCATMSAVGAAVVIAMTAPPIAAQNASRATSDDKTWQAVAPGLVEPRSGEIKVTAPLVARISEVLIKANDAVIAGEPLVRLDDAEARARVATAQAQVALRRQARNDQAAGKAADRRRVEDAVAEAEAAVIDARNAFDSAAIAKRSGKGSDADLTTARSAWTSARDALARERAALRRVEMESGTPLPTQNEGQVNVARSELRLADVELDRLTVRAPIDGTVLQVNARLGERASPSAAQPLISLGDISALRVRAEVDERDLGQIKLGQSAMVRADAFQGREFSGKVAAIAPIVQAARISSPGSRNLSDFNVAEVLIDLAEPGSLVSGMKVDVYFRSEVAAQ